jgi:hypothetical protein
MQMLAQTVQTSTPESKKTNTRANTTVNANTRANTRANTTVNANTRANTRANVKAKTNAFARIYAKATDWKELNTDNVNRIKAIGEVRGELKKILAGIDKNQKIINNLQQIENIISEKLEAKWYQNVQVSVDRFILNESIRKYEIFIDVVQIFRLLVDKISTASKETILKPKLKYDIISFIKRYLILLEMYQNVLEGKLVSECKLTYYLSIDFLEDWLV